jgi:uncharacterized SAM-binding protein YcdF (DUF218 family)/lysophospholipase L1-like esterase
VNVSSWFDRIARGRIGFLAGLICGVALIAGGRLVINETEFADTLVGPLLLTDSIGRADAIVVMGAGVIGDCIPNLNGTRRVIHAARLWREERAPLVVFTGGTGDASCPVAEAMVRFAHEIGVPESSCLVERAARNTMQNGEFSAPLLRQAGAKRLLLVTDRLHMRRAAGAFTRLGFDVQRASVPVYEGHVDNVDMLGSAMREAAAVAYYRARGWLGPIDLPGDAASNQTPIDKTMTTSAVKQAPLVIFGASYAGGWTPRSPAGLPVTNLGVAGQESFQMLERFERDVVPTGARAVVIWGFINDIIRGKDMDQTLARIRSSYVEMVALARSHRIEPILATEVTIRPSDSWSETVAALVGWVLGKESYQDRINRHVMATNAWLKDLAKQENLLLLDLHGAVADANGRRRAEFIDKDGSHITPAGYAALTAYAAPILEEHLRVR